MAATEVDAQRELERRAQRLAEAVEHEAGVVLELAVFTAGGTTFGLAPSAIAEVQRIEALTRLPAVAGALAGLMAIRGELLPVASLARLAGRPDPELEAGGPWAVVIADGHAPLALLASSIGGLQSVEAAVQEPGPELVTALVGLVSGVTVDGVAVLDPDALLDDPRLTLATPPASSTTSEAAP